MLEFSVPGNLNNYFHFPKRWAPSQGTDWQGCTWSQRGTDDKVGFLQGERRGASGSFSEVPLEASKDCFMASGL